MRSPENEFELQNDPTTSSPKIGGAEEPGVLQQGRQERGFGPKVRPVELFADAFPVHFALRGKARLELGVNGLEVVGAKNAAQNYQPEGVELVYLALGEQDGLLVGFAIFYQAVRVCRKQARGPGDTQPLGPPRKATTPADSGKRRTPPASRQPQVK